MDPEKKCDDQFQKQTREQSLPQDTLNLIYWAESYLMHHEMTELMSGHITMEEQRRKMMQSIRTSIKKACAQQISVCIQLRIDLFNSKISDYEKSKEYLNDQIKRIGQGKAPTIENCDLSFQELSKQVESPLRSKLEFYNYLINKSSDLIKTGQKLIEEIQRDALPDGISKEKQELLQKAQRIQQLENERAAQDKLLGAYQEVLSQSSLSNLNDFSQFYDGIPEEAVKNFQNSSQFKRKTKRIGIQWALSQSISGELISMLKHFEGFKTTLENDITSLEKDSILEINKMKEKKINVYGKSPVPFYSAAQIQAQRLQKEREIAPLREQLAFILSSSVQADKMLAREYALQRKLNPKAFPSEESALEKNELRPTQPNIQISMVQADMTDISVIVDDHERLLPDFNDSIMDKI